MFKANILQGMAENRRDQTVLVIFMPSHRARTLADKQSATKFYEVKQCEFWALIVAKEWRAVCDERESLTILLNCRLLAAAAGCGMRGATERAEWDKTNLQIKVVLTPY